VVITDDILVAIPYWAAAFTPVLLAPSGPSSVQRQPDPAAFLKSFVSLRLFDHSRGRRAQAPNIQTLGEVSQGIVTERLPHP
jgi:hypothetical protein